MHAKTNGTPRVPHVDAAAPVTDAAASTPRLSGALAAAIGRKLPGTQDRPGGGGIFSRPDQVNKAPKPAGGAHRTSSPRQGHK